MSRPLQAIVFDFDGVIANSEPLHLLAFQQALADDGVELVAGNYTGFLQADMLNEAGPTAKYQRFWNVAPLDMPGDGITDAVGVVVFVRWRDRESAQFRRVFITTALDDPNT